mgnify:CR=1 FL=1
MANGKVVQIIGAVVDVEFPRDAIPKIYDALRMRRTYKEAYTHERAVETIVREKGTHFDPLLTSRFVAVSEDFRRIYSVLADPPPPGSRPEAAR